MGFEYDAADDYWLMQMLDGDGTYDPSSQRCIFRAASYITNGHAEATERNGVVRLTAEGRTYAAGLKKFYRKP